MDDSRRRILRTCALAAAIAACLVLGSFAFLRQEQVPLLAGVDLGFHELGHLLTMFWAPQIVTAAAGSATQVAVPLGLAAYFHFSRRDLVGTALMLAWVGTSMAGAATYIADAPYQQLELLGGPGGHDWAYIFGPEGLNDLPASGPFSTAVWIAGAAVLVFAIGLCVYGIAREAVAWRRGGRELARLATLPRREPRNPVLTLEPAAGAETAIPATVPSPQGAALGALIAEERSGGPSRLS
jgi:hypothetical protein